MTQFCIVNKFPATTNQNLTYELCQDIVELNLRYEYLLIHVHSQLHAVEEEREQIVLTEVSITVCKKYSIKNSFFLYYYLFFGR